MTPRLIPLLLICLSVRAGVTGPMPPTPIPLTRMVAMPGPNQGPYSNRPAAVTLQPKSIVRYNPHPPGSTWSAILPAPAITNILVTNEYAVVIAAVCDAIPQEAYGWFYQSNGVWYVNGTMEIDRTRDLMMWAPVAIQGPIQPSMTVMDMQGVAAAYRLAVHFDFRDTPPGVALDPFINQPTNADGIWGLSPKPTNAGCHGVTIPASAVNMYGVPTFR